MSYDPLAWISVDPDILDTVSYNGSRDSLLAAIVGDASTALQWVLTVCRGVTDDDPEAGSPPRNWRICARLRRSWRTGPEMGRLRRSVWTVRCMA